MRLLTGVAIDGRVVEMALPSDIPVAHLMPELLAALGTEDGRLKLRRVDGSWFDLERSLGDQGCVTGGVVCLEAPEVQSHGRHHDPVAELVERGPPVELIADAAVPAVIGAAAAVGLLALTDRSAPVVVALAPCAWALLPWLAGSSIALRRVSTLMATLSLMVSAAALAAAGPVAAHRPLEMALDGCVAVVALAHVARRRSTSAILRVGLGAVEWVSLAAVIPLASFAAGWSRW